MHVYFLQHHPDYGPARFTDWLTGMGHSYNTCLLYQDEIPPKPSDFDALIVLDGPDSALEPEPYLQIKRERKLIQKVLTSAKPLLGVGYGGLLIAQALGAIISPGTYPELGWHTVRRAPACPLALPESFDAFHWHKEIFSLPEEAVPIGSTAASPIQGFCWDEARVISLLFHVEATHRSAEALMEAAVEEPVLEELDSVSARNSRGGHAGFSDYGLAHSFVQSPQEILEGGRRFDRLAPLLDRIMLNWLALE
ncbi:hypothetical protein LMG33818_002597 [Halomonadaceae bacterium LMG 33818]|uniref:type 1 glutamine amidotransferase n=1 Tax=Cernens ardua TaxID=3402176 RepID=UPI003EDC292B